MDRSMYSLVVNENKNILSQKYDLILGILQKTNTKINTFLGIGIMES